MVPDQGKKTRRIGIGEYYASASPVVISTLLGSCVAACLWDPVRKIGGMNHILLPGRADMQHFNTPARFGVNAMELLINEIVSLGGRKTNLVAKIFGGSNIYPVLTEKFATGQRIVAFVKEFLSLESIEIINENTGGTDTRVIYFHTDTCDVFLKRTVSSMREKIVSQENEMLRKLKEEAAKLADIEWFH
ncbi:MAG: chemotaxis protein CheD [Proteobacteria bacterium]|nr:chemotaxis protein CheD [Pseudomonadota bacterium]MBU4297098.1 chemotaxis protein CheD [Pseudomonadota bacterium]MCG2747406.1 chemotaxis protein CheD [Desulfobulbaceae bacterium]